MTYPKPYQRGNIYYFKYRLNKKSVQKSTGKSGFREAQRFIKDFIDRLESQTTDATLGTFLEMFSNVDTNPKYKEARVMEGHYSLSHAEHVAISSRQCIELLRRSKYFDKPLHDFKRFDIKDIAEMIVEKHGNRQKSVKMFKHIKMVFNYAEKEGILPYSPARNVADIKYQQIRKSNAISKDDLVRVFSSRSNFKTYVEFCMFNLAAFTGMRRGEILAMHWDQIDFDNNTIMVNRAIKGTDTIGLPKWDKVRVIPIASLVAKNLHVLYSKSRSKRVFCVGRKPISTKTYNNWFKKVSESHNLGITGHGLRHSLHTQLRALGCPDSLLSEYFSWSKQNQKAIQERYTDYMVDELKPVANMINGIIDSLE